MTSAPRVWLVLLGILLVVPRAAFATDLLAPVIGQPTSFEAQSDTTPVEAPGAVGQTVEAAKSVARRFQDQFLGQSITVGVADVLTGATLTTSAGTFESYTGPSTVTPSVAFNSASAHGLVTQEYDMAGIHWTDSISFVADYAQFADNKQTVQKLIGGQSPDGFIRGDFLYGVALFAYNGIYEGQGTNVAFRFGAGLGAAFAHFNGQVDYASQGRNVAETFSQDYGTPMLAYLVLFETRINHIVLSAQSIELTGKVKTNVTDTNFVTQIGLVTFTAGYAFYF
jgi:hypothetical protein